MTTPDSLAPALTEEDVSRLCGSTVYQLGQRYYRNGAVLRPRIEGDVLRAEVQGSRSKPYKVSVTVAPDQIVSSCDCPYWAEYCKHAGALLVAWARAPHSFVQSKERLDQSTAGAASPTAQPASTPAARALETSLPPDLLPGDGSPAEELQRLLDLRTVQELRLIARRRSLPLRGTAKTELLPQLVASLLEPEGLRAAIAALQAPELVALDLVHLLAGGRLVKARHVKEAITALEVSLPGDVDALLLDLRDRGLVANGARGGYEADCYCVPAGVLPHLPPADYLVRRIASGALPAAVAPTRLPPDELLYLLGRHFQQHTVQRRPPVERTLMEKTSELLRGWHNVPEEVAVLKPGTNWEWRERAALTALPAPPQIADADLDVLALLAGGDREAVEFGFHLLRQLRLLSGKDRFLAHDDVLRQFLRLTPPLRRQAIAVAWLQLTDWSELTLALRHDGRLRLRRLLTVFGTLKPKELFERLAEGRRLLVRFLLRLEEGVWYALPALSETLRAVAGDKLADQTLWQGQRDAKWWLDWDGAGQLDPRLPEDWALGYGRFVVEALRGPLAWLGVATVAEAGGELAFRLDGLDALLDATSSPAEAAPPLRVAADLTVTVPAGYADLQVHDFLLAVAEPGEATLEGLRYRLTPARACAAFAAGHDAATIIAFLERGAARNLPATVRATLQDWWQRYGSLHLYANLALLEFADDYTLPELLATTGLSRHLIYEFSPRLIAVDPAALDGLVDELVRKGYTPKVTEGAE